MIGLRRERQVGNCVYGCSRLVQAKAQVDEQA